MQLRRPTAFAVVAVLGTIGLSMALETSPQSDLFPPIFSTDSPGAVEFKKTLQKIDLKSLADNKEHSGDVKHWSADAPHVRSRRSANFECDAGWTGNACQFPVCDSVNQHKHPKNPIQETVIDFYYQKPETVAYAYVDHMMSAERFEIISTDINSMPSMQLVNSDGNRVVPTAHAKAVHSVFYTYNNLSSGVYKILFDADYLYSDLLVIFYANTSLNVEVGGIPYSPLNETALHNDFPSLKVYKDTPTVFMANPIGLESGDTFETVSFFNFQTFHGYNIRLNRRYGCHYQYYTAEFECKTDGIYFARFHGFDFYGRMFTRIQKFVCEVIITTTPPNINTTCSNNGVLITNADSSQYCYCKEHFTGTSCQYPLCMNGGSRIDSYCICPTGYNGLYCEHITCPRKSTVAYHTGAPILTFVLRVRSQLNDVIAQVASAVQSVTQSSNYNSAYFSKFALISFNGDTTNYQTFFNASDFVRKLQSLALSVDTSGGCQDSVFELTNNALYHFAVTNKSPIYVITDVVSYDHDVFASPIMMTNSFYNAPISFLVIEPNADAGCPEINLNSASFQSMNLIARRFNGISTLIRNNSRENVGTLLQTLLTHTNYRTHLVFSDDQATCDNLPTYIPIIVDAKFHELAIVVGGVNPSVQLNSPEGYAVNLTGSYSIDSLSVFWVTELESGMWTATINTDDSSSSCKVRVYAVEDPTLNTINKDYNIVWGFTDTLNHDAPYRQPIVRTKTSIVAHIENYVLESPTSLHAELIIFRDAGKDGRVFVSASDGRWRDGCSFEIYFAPIVCKNEGENLYFTIFVRNAMGATSQHSGVFFCTSAPLPVPGPGYCDNGGVMLNNTCICQENWTGKSCQIPICFNNGIRDSWGNCVCPAGVTGDFCKVLSCIDRNNNSNIFNANLRHHLFVIDVTKSNRVALLNVVLNIAEVISESELQDMDWITRYHIVGVDSTNYYHLGSALPNENGQIQAAFKAAYNMVYYSKDTSCEFKVYEALEHILLDPSLALNNNSYITIITTAAPDESRLNDLVMPIYNHILSHRHIVHIFVASKSLNDFYCGTQTNYTLFNDLATLSDGRFIPLDPYDIYLGLKIIPTLYKSSLVYTRHFSNCSNTVSVFAPIDTFTKSIQIYVNGDNAQNGLTIMLPNGTVTNLVYDVTDNVNQFGFYDYRFPCEPGWTGTESSPSCYLFVDSEVSWTEAQSHCANENAFLADTLTSSKASWLSKFVAKKPIWIGLNSLNDRWEWDRGLYDYSVTFNGSIFNRLYDDEINPLERCIYADTYWYTDNCNTANYSYVCQKHKYNSAMYVSHQLTDYVATGRWQFNFQSDSDCKIEIRVQSLIGVYSGFTTQILSDYPSTQAIPETTQNRVVTHVEGIDKPGSMPLLRFLQITDGFNETLLAAATYQYRTNCEYEYVSQNFVCPNTSSHGIGRFNMLHIGEDEYGMPFQRITSGLCLAEKASCNNRGIINNGLCICEEYWSGRHCEVPICINGGSFNPLDSICNCPKGFVGASCQFPVCSEQSNTTFSTYDKTLVLVIEATVQNAGAVNSLANNFAYNLNDTDPDWFSNIVVVSFDSTGVIYAESVPTIDAADTLLGQVAANLTINSACELPVLEAIIKGLSISSFNPESFVYLITTAGSSVKDQQKISNFYEITANSNIHLQYVLVPSPTCSNSVTTPSRYFIADLAVATDGNVVEIGRPNKAGTFVQTHLLTLYASSLIGTPTHNNGSFSCEQTVFYAAVETSVTTIYLYSFSNDAVPFVQGPYTEVTLTTLYEDDRTRIISFKPEDGQGIYTITINDTGTCNLQVRFADSTQIYLNYIPIAPSTIDNTLDDSIFQPAPGNNILVAHASDELTLLTYAQIWPEHSLHDNLQYLKMYSRSDCSYEFYSDSFVCNEFSYHVRIYGIYNGGQPFVREAYVQCVGVAPNRTTPSTTTKVTTVTSTTVPTTKVTTVTSTTVPTTKVTMVANITVPATQTTRSIGTTVPTPPPTTSFGYFQVKADIVLMLDVGLDVSQTQQVDFTSFFINALSVFDVGFKKNVQVSIVVILGDDVTVPMVQAPFYGISNINDVKGAIQSSYGEAIESGGQIALAGGFKLVGSYLTAPALGYRSDISNHLVVYATTNATADDNAITEAASVISSKKFDVAAVAYGSGDNVASLTRLVGGKSGCVITAKDANSLTTTAADSFVRLIWNAANNDGNYCT